MEGKRPRDGWRGEQHETNGKIETRSENAVVLTSTLPAVIAIAFSSRKFGFSLFYVCLVWPGLGWAGPCLRLFILFFPHFVFFLFFSRLFWSGVACYGTTCISSLDRRIDFITACLLPSLFHFANGFRTFTLSTCSHINSLLWLLWEHHL